MPGPVIHFALFGLLFSHSQKAGFPRKVQAELCTHLQIAFGARKYCSKMETGKSLKPIYTNQHKLEKLSKKVTWSENLTDVRILTPQPSVFEHFASLEFLEEEKYAFIKEE